MPFVPETAAEDIQTWQLGQSSTMIIDCLPEGREAEMLSRLCGFRVVVGKCGEPGVYQVMRR